MDHLHAYFAGVSLRERNLAALQMGLFREYKNETQIKHKFRSYLFHLLLNCQQRDRWISRYFIFMGYLDKLMFLYFLNEIL